VFDPTRGLVAGASVTIGGRSTTTGEDGRYVIGGLAAGEHPLAVFARGFTSYSAVVVVRDRGMVRDVVLSLPPVEERVQVSAKFPAADVAAEQIGPTRVRTSDTASLTAGVPGVSLYTNGGLASLPVVHGLADDRINVLINGMSVSSACANHMNPPMSYIDPANVGSVTVIAGLTPVSEGADNLGGSILVESPPAAFARSDQGVQVHGTISVFHRSNGVVNGGYASLSLATRGFSFAYTGSDIHANDYKNGAGVMIGSTFYESQNHVLKLAASRGRSLVTLDLGTSASHSKDS
jgi:iron complex outermembrane receptor protein